MKSSKYIIFFLLTTQTVFAQKASDIENWYNSVAHEFQDKSLKQFVNHQDFQLRYNLLSDAYFEPVFGKKYSELTKSQKTKLDNKFQSIARNNQWAKYLSIYIWLNSEDVSKLNAARVKYYADLEKIKNGELDFYSLREKRKKIRQEYGMLMPSELALINTLLLEQEAKAGDVTLNSKVEELKNLEIRFSSFQVLNSFYKENEILFNSSSSETQELVRSQINDIKNQLLEKLINNELKNLPSLNFDQLDKLYENLETTYKDYRFKEPVIEAKKKVINAKITKIGNQLNAIESEIENTDNFNELAAKQDKYLNLLENSDSPIIEDVRVKINARRSAIAKELSKNQNPEKWIKSYGVPDNEDEADAIIQTSDGGYAIAGVTSVSNLDRGTDFWIMKLDNLGYLLWDKTFKKGHAYDIIETKDGGFAVAGLKLLKKLDSNGTLQWEKELEGAAYSIVQTIDGGYALAGRIRSEEKKGLWVVKLDSNGILQWDKTFEGYQANSIIQTTDGGLAVAGFVWIKGYYENSGFQIIKIDKQGTLLWSKTYAGGANSDEAQSIIQTKDGGYVVTGFIFKGNTTQILNSYINNDLWVLKLNSNGEKQWEQSFGGDYDDGANSIVQTTDGGYILAGYTKSKGNGEKDFWVLKLSVSGDLQWDKSFGKENDDVANSIIQTTDEGYAVTGFTTGTETKIDRYRNALDWHSKIKYKLKDVWIIKLDKLGNLK
ncbi:MAG: hypothetical protein R2757_22380 [Draconibacterium sp.]